MKPLSGLDATFLYAETERTPMNVLATLVVDGPVDDAALINDRRTKSIVTHQIRRGTQ